MVDITKSVSPRFTKNSSSNFHPIELKIRQEVLLYLTCVDYSSVTIELSRKKVTAFFERKFRENDHQATIRIVW